MDTRQSGDTTRILVWLPSPMGDAVLSTPALRALRQGFVSARVTFYANQVVRQVLSPTSLCDGWLDQAGSNCLSAARTLRQGRFTHAILLKNSFRSGLACLLAAIPSRIGYARDGRGILLTDRLYPPRDEHGELKPRPAIDSYLAIAEHLGCDARDRSLELAADPRDREALSARLPGLDRAHGPVVVLVPGGTFGPSKCWPAERFALTADWLVDQYHALVVVSVAPQEHEKRIAGRIVAYCRHRLVNLADSPLTLGQVKALLSVADLMITNDTGPRHIAIAMKRRVITLFGPNDPAWTDTGWPGEIQLVGKAPCAPCASPTCRASGHLCMESITVEEVCQAAATVLG